MMSTHLSPHFTLEELTQSQIAARLGLDNRPGADELANLRRTADGLEAVRMRLGGTPVVVSSGYRSLAVNRVLGSKDTSQHVKGLAADFTAPRFGTPENVVHALVDSGVDYDQLILEYGSWVHVSFTPTPRRQAFSVTRSGVHPLA